MSIENEIDHEGEDSTTMVSTINHNGECDYVAEEGVDWVDHDGIDYHEGADGMIRLDQSCWYILDRL